MVEIFAIKFSLLLRIAQKRREFDHQGLEETVREVCDRFYVGFSQTPQSAHSFSGRSVEERGFSGGSKVKHHFHTCQLRDGLRRRGRGYQRIEVICCVENCATPSKGGGKGQRQSNN